ncbi:hypothetical protein JCM3766R1_003917 [Sporobolomyces carnicolor]
MLVLLVKCILESRNLHRVKRGGLGGFSILCLCVWFMQTNCQSPDKQSPVDDLTLFFHVFSGGLDLRNLALSTARGGCLLRKKSRNWESERNPDKLSIQHPVQLERDLSAGSYRWNTIERLFRDNHNFLAQATQSPRRPTLERESILGQLGVKINRKTIRLRKERYWLSQDREILDYVWDPVHYSAAAKIPPM